MRIESFVQRLTGRLAVALALAFLASSPSLAVNLRIATFNIQNFGKTKAADPHILSYLAEVIRKFDIVAVQEISDVTEEAPTKLQDAINSYQGAEYGLLLSERTGKQADDHSSQEQYAFYYNASRVVSVDDGWVFKDSAHDYFQREPYTAQFAIVGTTASLSITTIHTRPESAVEEIDALKAVYDKVVDTYAGEDNHVILGDFNGSCDYATPAQLKALEIRQPPFTWIVPDKADTNVNPGKACAYDRIVADAPLQKHYKSWGVADWFDKPAISDHWPVWVTFRFN
jgi:endonuclease/exonuclease/phosphatase family metal-dependent hydrolase